jgi:molecular chaperone Hsp33
VTDASLLPDDRVAAFQIEDQPVRGRIVRLGPAIDAVLSAHAYPDAVAELLGEACALAALIGSSLKFDGRLIVQAQGDGPVRYVVCDYGTEGTLRGYCRYDADELAALTAGDARPGAHRLLGKGVFVMTLDQGPDFDRHQGITPIEGDSLALCAEHYFMQSEQVPTEVRLAVGHVTNDAGSIWRVGGMMIQRLAADAARGDTEDAWDRARALFNTISADELIDPMVPSETLLYRLFHEDGVRLEAAHPLEARCRCSPDRIATVLDSFTDAERAEMVEPDGKIHITCEYCATVYALEAGAGA